MSMHVYWTLAFIFPKSVIDKIEKICRGYLWGNTEEHRRLALVVWENLCLPKNCGGIGLKMISVWNVASLGKQVWAIMKKKDQLWVKWISSIYLKHGELMEIQVQNTDSWQWKQLMKVRNALRDGLNDDAWPAIVNGEYNVAAAYKWLIGPKDTFRYHRAVWHKLVLPKHCIILWLVLFRKLLTVDKLSSWGVPNVDMGCTLCMSRLKSINHLFFNCGFSRVVMMEIAQWM